MEIKFDELHQICERLFQQVKDSGQVSITVDVDYYWDIPQENIYDPYKEPSNLNLGQLTENWKELQKILMPDEEPFGYNFVWLSTILRVVGEKLIL